MKQDPYWGSTNIECYRAKWVAQKTWRPEFVHLRFSTTVQPHRRYGKQA